MCEFLSAVKTKDKNGKDKYLYLTYDLIHNTPTGQLLQKKYGGDDLIGHSAIREYFEVRSGEGENWECPNFSTPKNFPTVIVKAIKRGEFRGFGTPKELLTAPAWEQYQKVEAQALEQYQKVEAPAWEQYQKVEAQALEQYQKVEAPAWEQYKKVKAQAFWDLFADTKNRAEAWR